MNQQAGDQCITLTRVKNNRLVSRNEPVCNYSLACLLRSVPALARRQVAGGSQQPSLFFSGLGLGFFLHLLGVLIFFFPSTSQQIKGGCSMSWLGLLITCIFRSARAHGTHHTIAKPCCLLVTREWGHCHQPMQWHKPAQGLFKGPSLRCPCTPNAHLTATRRHEHAWERTWRAP